MLVSIDGSLDVSTVTPVFEIFLLRPAPDIPPTSEICSASSIISPVVEPAVAETVKFSCVALPAIEERESYEIVLFGSEF